MLENIRRIKTDLLQGVEVLVKNKKISHLDAALLYCERNNIDLDQAASIIQADKGLTAKIESDARNLNFLKS